MMLITVAMKMVNKSYSYDTFLLHSKSDLELFTLVIDGGEYGAYVIMKDLHVRDVFWWTTIYEENIP